MYIEQVKLLKNQRLIPQQKVGDSEVKNDNDTHSTDAQRF